MARNFEQLCKQRLDLMDPFDTFEEIDIPRLFVL